MKQGWEIKKLGDVCTIKGRIGYRGYTKQDLVEKGEGAISLSPSNIFDNKFISDECTYISWFKYEESPEIMIFNGDILFVKTGSTYGKVALVEDLPEKATINPQFVVLKELKCLNKFLYYSMTTGQFKEQVEGIIGGAATPTLSQTNLAELKIPLPPLPEQQRIVAILDEAFATIAKAKANAEQNLKNAKELFESYLQGVFKNKGEGWEEKTLKELTTHLGDGLHGTPKYTIEGDYYFINGNNLTDGVIEFKESTKRVSIDEYNKHKKNLTNRTVLVSINGTLGNVAFYNGENIILGKSACYFNLKESVDKNFIRYVLSSPYFLNYAHKEATGATIKNVSLKTMREFLVPIPSIKEQQTIVQKLDALSAETKKLEAIYQQKIDDLEELKKSVLQKAFNGELKTAKALV